MWNSSLKLNSKALCFYYNIQLQVEEPWFGIRGRCHPFANCRGIMGESWFLRVWMTIIAIRNETTEVCKRNPRNFSHTSRRFAPVRVVWNELDFHWMEMHAMMSIEFNTYMAVMIATSRYTLYLLIAHKRPGYSLVDWLAYIRHWCILYGGPVFDGCHRRRMKPKTLTSR